MVSGVIHRWVIDLALSSADGAERTQASVADRGPCLGANLPLKVIVVDFDTSPAVAAQSSGQVTKTPPRYGVEKLQNSPTVGPLPAQSSVRHAAVGEFCSFDATQMVLTRDFVAVQSSGRARRLSSPGSGRVETPGCVSIHGLRPLLDGREKCAQGHGRSTVGGRGRRARGARPDDPSIRCQPLARPCPIDSLLLQAHALPESVLDESPIEALFVG